MADLGNLHFSVRLKDMTDEDRAKIEKKLSAMQTNINVGASLDANSIKGVQEKLRKTAVEVPIRIKSLSETEVNNLTSRLSKNGIKIGVSLDASKKTLTDSIQSTLSGKTFDANVRVVVQSASVQEAISRAFASAGLTIDPTQRKGLYSDMQRLYQQRYATEVQRTQAAATRAQMAVERLAQAQNAQSRASQTASHNVDAWGNRLRYNQGIVNSLRNELLSLYSIWGIKQAFVGLVEIGGEFQKQQVAIESMLGSGAKAAELFQKIKSLAIESPFSTLDLTAYIKQLTAYNIPYNELFETTKRLADVSAGLGVDMNRLILAYGQVRSAEFLKGTELRQFTEAGVPMLQMLADQFTVLEGRAVIVGEVFDKISKRQVPFEMVKKALWDMTDAGGQFYNMQAVLTDTLAGQMDKLADSWEIAVSEIAQSNGGTIGGILSGLTGLVNSWQTVLKVVTSVGLAFISYKSIATAVGAVDAVLAIRKYGLAGAAAIATKAIEGESAALAKMNVRAAAGVQRVNALKVALAGLALPSAIIAGVAALGTFLYKSYQNATKLKRALGGVLSEAASEVTDAVQGYKSLVKQLGDAAQGSEEYKAIIDKIQSQYGQYLGNLTEESRTYAYLAGQIDKVTLALKRKYAEEARQKGESEIKAEYADAISYSQKALTAGLVEAGLGKGTAQGVVMAFMESVKEGITSGTLGETSSEMGQTLNAVLQKLGLDSELDESKLKRGSLELWATKLAGAIASEAKEISDFVKATEDAFGVELGVGTTGEAAVTPKVEKAKDNTSEWKERIKLIRQAVAEYKKWKEVVGADAARQHVLESPEFASVLEYISPEGYLAEPEKIREAISKAVGGNAKLQSLYTSLGLKIDDYELSQLKEQAEIASSTLQEELEKSAKKWDLYSKMFEVTGDAEKSRAFAFSTAFNVTTPEIEDLQNKFNTALKEKGFEAEIPFTMSDAEAEKTFGKENGELYQMWRTLKEKIEGEEISVKTNIVDALKNGMSVAQRYEAALEQRDYELSIFGDDTESDAYKAVVEKWEQSLNELRSELTMLNPAFQQLFGDTFGMGVTEMKRIYAAAQALVNLIRTTGTPDVDADGNTVGYSFTGTDGKESYITADSLKNVEGQLDKFSNKTNKASSAFDTLLAKLREGKTEDVTFELAAKAVAELSEAAAGAASDLSGMFENLGNEGLADTIGLIGSVAGGFGQMANAAASFASGNYLGGITSALSGITGIIGSIAAAHDKKLDRKIEKSKVRAQKLQNVYDAIERGLEHFLGSGKDYKVTQAEEEVERYQELRRLITQIRSKKKISVTDLAALQEYKEELSNLEARVTAYETGGAYAYQRQLYMEELEELQYQLEKEEAKKKSDASTIADYEDEIAELEQEIADFAEETLDELYGLNLQDWASDLGDALFDAWQEGADGVEAYEDAVSDLMGDLMNEVLKVTLLEPALEELQEMLFGEDGLGGMFGEDFELDESEIESIADYLMGISSKTDDYYDALDKLNEYMEEKYGVSLKEESESSGLSKSISSVTEETADLLASYVNAIRADVSAKREYVRQMAEELMPAYNTIAQAQLTQLQAIQANTATNAEYAEAIYDILHRNILGTNTFKIA